MNRPSETVSAAVGSIVGALVAILTGYGLNVPQGVEAAGIVIVSWIAAGVTWLVARRQRMGRATSASDGKVT